MRESRFQAALIKELKERFPRCVVIKNDSSYIQGIPDLLVLFRNKWAALEVKAEESSDRQPNQEYYVDLMNGMSFAAFIWPENKEEVLHALELTFSPRRKARNA